MRDAEIRCKNFKCNYLNENGDCTVECAETHCIMECSYHSDCTECVTDCEEHISEDGFIIK